MACVCNTRVKCCAFNMTAIMTPVTATIVALLAIAQEIVAEPYLDVEKVLRLLAALPVEELDLQTRGAVRHAQLMAVSAQGSSTKRDAVARFALHRVVVLLEQHVAARTN